MRSIPHFTKAVWAVAASLLMAATAFGQPKNPEIAGAVRLRNGLILYGLCDSANTIDPDLQDKRLELRRINQQFRTYFVSTRRSDEPRPDELAVPKHEFRMIQRRTSQRPLNYEIGLHSLPPFQPDGRSVVTLQLSGGEKVNIDVGVTSLNAGRVAVDGLSHQWNFGVSMATIPETTLYAGPEAPSLLKNAREFRDREARLNMVQMLLQAEKYTAAQNLLSDIEAQFPDLKSRCERLTDIWNDRVGKRVLEELDVLRHTGKYETARHYARAWPDQKLAPVIRVKAKQFLDNLEQDNQRLKFVRESLSGLVAEIEDDTIRRQAMQVWTELLRELDLNTLPRLAAFELLQLDDTLSAESKLALAASGLILGSDAAIENFPNVYGLFQIRFLLQDYLRTTDDELTVRNSLLEQLRNQEGFSIERLASLLQYLPPILPFSMENSAADSPERFVIADDTDMAGCLGQVPREYAVTRRYPLLIAFPREGLSAADTIQWWGHAADRDGYIVVVPSLYPETTGQYDASASQHRRLLNLLRRLKARLAIDDDRVFVAGHGIGGEAAMDIATSHPDLFAGVISLAGLGRKELLWTAHNSASLPWYIVVGSRQPRWYQRIGPLLEELFRRTSDRGRVTFCDMLFVRYDERGFESYAEELPNLFRWMNLQKRAALPDRISARTLRSTDRSWFWLELDAIPQRFVSLDEPSLWSDQPAADGPVFAEINGNLIRFRSLSTDGTLLLSPNLPEIDLSRKINIVTVSGRTLRVDYQPSTRDLLEHFRERLDRTRLCFMKVPIMR